MSYSDVTNIDVSDELIDEYKSKGVKSLKTALKEKNEEQLSKETIKKYQLSNAQAENIPADLITKFEELSKKTGKPTKELIKEYNKSIRK